jgi:hypothetical protein
VSRRFHAGSWSPAILLDKPSVGFCSDLTGKFVASSKLAVAFRCDDDSTTFATNDGPFSVYSTDGGVTFSSRQRINDAAPTPTAYTGEMRLQSDDAQNLWIEWQDYGAGHTSIVSRLSTDGGATWSTVRRLDRTTPQGGRLHTPVSREGAIATFSRTALFAFTGSRESSLSSLIVNAWSLDDFDRDGLATASDCNDSDPDVWNPGAEVTHVTVSGAVATVVSWDSQGASAGPGTTYDLVTGALGSLRQTGTFAASTCLAGNLATASAPDTRANPAPGDGTYYLARARNVCGAGTYGNSSLPVDPRDALDASSPCP